MQGFVKVEELCLNPYLIGWPLVICCEFSCHDDSNAWRKSTKEAEKDKNFYCNLERKNLSMHLCHHCTNSCQYTSVAVEICWLAVEVLFQCQK